MYSILVEVRNRLSCISVAALSFALLGSGCSGSSPSIDGERDTHDRLGTNVEVLKWSVRSVVPPRTLRIGGRVGYCVGDPKPRVRSSQARYRHDNVLVRLEVVIPHHKSVEKGTICGGVELFVGRTITFRRDLSDIMVYDSGVEPPKLRWPQ